MLGKDTNDDPGFERPKAGKLRQPAEEFGRRVRLAPEGRRIPAVGRGDDAADALDALRHAGREAMDRRRSGEGRHERVGAGAGEADGVERAEAVANAERPEEGALDGELLIETETD